MVSLAGTTMYLPNNLAAFREYRFRTLRYAYESLEKNEPFNNGTTFSSTYGHYPGVQYILFDTLL